MTIFEGLTLVTCLAMCFVMFKLGQLEGRIELIEKKLDELRKGDK